MRKRSLLRGIAVVCGAGGVLIGAGGCGPGDGGDRADDGVTSAAEAPASVAGGERGSGPDGPIAFAEPPEVVSRGGVLGTTLRAAPARLEIGGREVETRVYNGLFTPPTLRVRPGDVIRLRLENAIDEWTNLHYHGMNVSPLGNGDNIFVWVDPGESFDYEIEVPEDHPSGLFWYHPHPHRIAERQVLGGMSGGLIVDGLLDPIPELRGIEERIMLLKDIQIASDGRVPDDIDSNAGTTRTLNGQVVPTLRIRPGETQLWRIGNIGADIFYRLKLDGHTLHEIARDGNRRNQIIPRDEIVLPPSARVEVLVQGSEPGVYQFRTLAFDTGPAGDQYPEAILATVVSEGRSETPLRLPDRLPAVEDLRTRPVDRRRTIVFSEDASGEQFYIDGKQYDPDRVDTRVELGTLEEWTIRNESDELHVFHIHQVDFQVTEVNGEAQPFIGYQDTQITPIRGEVKLLIPFTNPVIVGKFVYHCHIMSHEDNGMMAVIEVR